MLSSNWWQCCFSMFWHFESNCLTVSLFSMNINVHFNSQQGPERPLLLYDIFQSMLITKHGGMRALYQESSTSASNQWKKVCVCNNKISYRTICNRSQCPEPSNVQVAWLLRVMSLVATDISPPASPVSHKWSPCHIATPISRWRGRRLFWCGTQRARIRLYTSRRQRRQCQGVTRALIDWE